MSWRVITLVVLVGLLPLAECVVASCQSMPASRSTLTCPAPPAPPSTATFMMAAATARASGDCCSTRAPGATFYEANSTWLPLQGSASLLESSVSARPASPAPGDHPDLPDRAVAVQWAPLYTLHSALLI